MPNSFINTLLFPSFTCWKANSLSLQVWLPAFIHYIVHPFFIQPGLHLFKSSDYLYIHWTFWTRSKCRCDNDKGSRRFYRCQFVLDAFKTCECGVNAAAMSMHENGGCPVRGCQIVNARYRLWMLDAKREDFAFISLAVMVCVDKHHKCNCIQSWRDGVGGGGGAGTNDGGSAFGKGPRLSFMCFCVLVSSIIFVHCTD
jgi:hypothetical protein